jgi:SpoIID/LytB domain protein
MKISKYLVVFFLFLLGVVANSCAASLRKADELYTQGKYDLALEQYQQLIESEPTALLEVAALHRERGDYAKAIEYFQQYLSQHENTTAKFLLAQTLYLSGNTDKALIFFSELAQKGKDWRVYLYLGLIYQQKQQLSWAVKQYRRSLKLQKNSIALYQLGKIFYHKKLYKISAGYFKDLLDFDASIKLANYYLGDCLLHQGDYKKGYRYLAKSKQFYPDSKDIKNKLKLARGKLGEQYFLKAKKAKEQQRYRVKLSTYKKQVQEIEAKVLLADNLKKIGFKSGRSIDVTAGSKKIKLKANTFYSLNYKKDRVDIIDQQKQEVIAQLGLPLVLDAANSPFYILEIEYGANQFWHNKSDIAFRGKLKLVADNDTFDLINLINLEEYLYGVLPSEIYPSSDIAALRAQAVAARTLAYRRIKLRADKEYHLEATIYSQVYRGITQEDSRTNKAVDDTRGEIITYNQKPIEAFFHAHCGGCLRNKLFGNQAYLRYQFDEQAQSKPVFSPVKAQKWFLARSDAYCAQNRGAKIRWQRIYDQQDFAIAFGFDMSQVKSISISNKGQCEHAQKIIIEHGDQLDNISGDLDIRDYLDNLRSSAFKMHFKYNNLTDKTPQILFIWGAGFGHGVGICQEGMTQMAREGFDYQEIIRHYYQGIEIKKVY